MPSAFDAASKHDRLAAAGALHARPDRVAAEPFRQNPFFDPCDKAQVKYEMLRAHLVDGESVAAAAARFGFSRETFYHALHSFQAGGLAGLRDEKCGRRRRLKLSADDVTWVRELARAQPAASGRVIAQRLLDERGVHVHRRSVERLLATPA